MTYRNQQPSLASSHSNMTESDGRNLTMFPPVPVTPKKTYTLTSFINENANCLAKLLQESKNAVISHASVMQLAGFIATNFNLTTTFDDKLSLSCVGNAITTEKFDFCNHKSSGTEQFIVKHCAGLPFNKTGFETLVNERFSNTPCADLMEEQGIFLLVFALLSISVCLIIACRGADFSNSIAYCGDVFSNSRDRARSVCNKVGSIFRGRNEMQQTLLDSDSAHAYVAA